MADKTEDTGPGREQTWGEQLEARVDALEQKAGLKKKADTADTKEEK